MPDLTIVIRARDEASGVLRTMGGQLQGLGKFAVAAGVAATGAMAGIGASAVALGMNFNSMQQQA